MSNLSIKTKRVLELANISRATLYRYLNDDNMKFPKPFQFTPGGPNRWYEEQVRDWINQYGQRQ